MIAFIFGTRPEIIKLSSLILLFKKRKIPFKVIYTGQHYDPLLSSIFFKQLDLPKPDVSLGIKPNLPALQLGCMITGISKALQTEKGVKGVIVQGDTNSALAGALCANKMKLKLYHVEAGLRSYDDRMQEEHNRKVIDHLSDIAFAPTVFNKRSLLAEGISPGRIKVVGNTLIDTLSRMSSAIAPKEPKKQYLLLTLHRDENIQDKGYLTLLMYQLSKLHDHLGMPILFPAHPKTKKRLGKMAKKEREILLKGVTVIPPLSYSRFLSLLSNAHLVLTDSGGVQEECSFFNVPCVTLRESTERQETVKAGKNLIVPIEKLHSLPTLVYLFLSSFDRKKGVSLYGDGDSAEQIVKEIFPDNG